MIVFFTDLDNTLIYSHRREMAVPKVTAERLEGREQSYMSRGTLEFLRHNRFLETVPVTTRTEKQYRRLEHMEEIGVRYAILCNGGKLLSHGREDERWTRASLKAAESAMDALEAAAAELGRRGEHGVQRPEPYLVYAATADPARDCRELREALPGTVGVFHDRRKVYAHAAEINKGNALKRLMAEFGNIPTAAAGDGEPDIPMLDAADWALCGEKVFGRVANPRKILVEGEFISDGVCEALERLREQIGE